PFTLEWIPYSHACRFNMDEDFIWPDLGHRQGPQRKCLNTAEAVDGNGFHGFLRSRFDRFLLVDAILMSICDLHLLIPSNSRAAIDAGRVTMGVWGESEQVPRAVGKGCSRRQHLVNLAAGGPPESNG